MGLMGGNPYYAGNGFAEGINGFISGMNSELDRSQLNKVQDAQLKQQAEVLRMAKEKALQDELEAGQKMDEQRRLNDYRAAVTSANAPTASSISMPGQSMPVGNGLLSGQSLEVAPMENRVLTPPNPADVQQKQATLYQQYDPAGYGKMVAENSFKTPTMNPIIAKLIEAAQNGSINEQGKAVLQQSGYDMFGQKPSDKETWNKPYSGKIGGKEVLLRKNNLGKVELVGQDTSTTVKVGVGNGGGGRGRPMPPNALKLQQEGLDAIGTASGLNKDLGGIQAQLENGTLDLSMLGNLTNTGRNLVGASTEKSRNFATFQATLEKLRNDSLRLNKGVQTEGDSVRAWNEILKNINDPEVVKQRLAEVVTINERAVSLHQNNVEVIRNNYGQPDLDFEKYTSLPSATNLPTSGKPATKQPAAASGPKKGDVVKGYMFMGGDPSNKKNWGKR